MSFWQVPGGGYEPNKRDAANTASLFALGNSDQARSTTHRICANQLSALIVMALTENVIPWRQLSGLWPWGVGSQAAKLFRSGTLGVQAKFGDQTAKWPAECTYISREALRESSQI